MNHKFIALDLDGVIFQFSPAYAKLLAEEHGADLLPAGWEDSDDVFCKWDWEAHHGYPPSTITKTLKRIGEDATFWQKLEPVEGAKGVVRDLNYLAKDGKVSCYYVTNRFGLKAKEQTNKALYELGCDYPTVLLASDKVPILKALDVVFFADDKLETATQAMTYKVPNTYLIDAPWNRSGRPEGLLVAKNVREALEKAGVL